VGNEVAAPSWRAPERGRRWLSLDLERAAGHWRTFADAVAAALGVNVWVALVLLPALYGGALASRLAIALCALPLAVLAVGVVRRSEAVLLFGFPSVLLLPLATAPEAAQLHTQDPLRFALVAVGLVAYLFGASVFTSFHEAPTPASIRPLASASRPVPLRWQRRFRVYAALAVLSLVFPLVLLGTIHFAPGPRRFLAERYADRVPESLILFDLAAIGAWLVFYAVFFLDILRGHRTGDRPLQGELARLAERARRPRPGLTFYLGVIAAIALMTLLVLLRR
jgi:hypothetical protein